MAERRGGDCDRSWPEPKVEMGSHHGDGNHYEEGHLLNRELPSPSVKLLLLTELLVWSSYLNYIGKGFSKRPYILSTIQASLYTVDRWCTDHVAVHHVTDYGSVNGVAS